MSWAAVVVRTLVGLMFLVFGLNGLLPKPFVEMPPLPDPAGAFIGLLVTTGYLKAVKALEVLGGVLLLSGRAAPLGVVILTPIAVNILLYEVYLLGAPGVGGVLTAMLVFLVWAYRRYFGPVFTLNAQAC